MPNTEVVVIARWTAAPNQESRVTDILASFLPQAQAEPGVKTFQIAHSKETPPNSCSSKYSPTKPPSRLTRPATTSRP